METQLLLSHFCSDHVGMFHHTTCFTSVVKRQQVDDLNIDKQTWRRAAVGSQDSSRGRFSDRSDGVKPADCQRREQKVRNSVSVWCLERNVLFKWTPSPRHTAAVSRATTSERCRNTSGLFMTQRGVSGGRGQMRKEEPKGFKVKWSDGDDVWYFSHRPLMNQASCWPYPSITLYTNNVADNQRISTVWCEDFDTPTSD